MNFAEETFMIVRPFAECAHAQEIARIMFVDDISKHTREIEHHAPTKIKPVVDLQPKEPEIVCSIVALFFGGFLMLYLGHVFSFCRY